MRCYAEQFLVGCGVFLVLIVMGLLPQGVILVYDITSEVSFINLQYWIKSLKQVSENCMEIILTECEHVEK